MSSKVDTAQFTTTTQHIGQLGKTSSEHGVRLERPVG